jgi:hypothetical protein
MSGTYHTLPETYQTFAKYAQIGVPVLLIGITWNFPAAMCYYWSCSNTFTVFQEYMLRIPAGVDTWRLLCARFVDPNAWSCGALAVHMWICWSQEADVLKDAHKQRHIQRARCYSGRMKQQLAVVCSAQEVQTAYMEGEDRSGLAAKADG